MCTCCVHENSTQCTLWSCKCDNWITSKKLKFPAAAAKEFSPNSNLSFFRFLYEIERYKLAALIATTQGQHWLWMWVAICIVELIIETASTNEGWKVFGKSFKKRLAKKWRFPRKCLLPQIHWKSRRPESENGKSEALFSLIKSLAQFQLRLSYSSDNW